jgi:protein-disulfide isomerase
MSTPIGNLYKNNSIEEKITIKKSTYNNLLKGMVAAIAIATFLGGYTIGTIDDNSNSSVTAEELKGIISELEIKTTTVQPSKVPIQQPSPSNRINPYQISIDDDPVKGDPNAPITIIEFSDFQCPFCSRFSSQTLPLLEENYIDTGKVKLVYKDLPLRIHPNARMAHIAAECADEQGKFWEYHDILFIQQSRWQSLSPSNFDTTLTNFAADLGMQSTDFEACMKSPEIANEVNEDSIEARSYGANGTPTFFIGNEKNGFVILVGAQPYSVFETMIDDQLGS